MLNGTTKPVMVLTKTLKADVSICLSNTCWNFKLSFIMLDIDQSRLDMAKSMGATYTLKVTSKDPREMAQQVEELMGVQPEITIECSGAAPSLQTAIYVS